MSVRLHKPVATLDFDPGRSNLRSPGPGAGEIDQTPDNQKELSLLQLRLLGLNNTRTCTAETILIDATATSLVNLQEEPDTEPEGNYNIKNYHAETG